MLLKHLCFYFSTNKSVQDMHSRYIYIGLNRNMLTTNSKLKKNIAEKIYRKKRGAHMWSFYGAYFMIEVVTIKH